MPQVVLASNFSIPAGHVDFGLRSRQFADLRREIHCSLNRSGNIAMRPGLFHKSYEIEHRHQFHLTVMFGSTSALKKYGWMILSDHKAQQTIFLFWMF